MPGSRTSYVRKLLDAVAIRAGPKPGEIRSKMFRHTYCAAQLQTVDQGAPMAVEYRVAQPVAKLEPCTPPSLSGRALDS